MDKKERMIEKIRKLFALADDENSQGAESGNALRMANKLLEKHSIEQYELATGATDVGISLKTYKKRWMINVASSISKLYSCKSFTTSRFGDEKKFVIVGTEANRITAVIVIEQLIAQITSDGKGLGVSFSNGAALSLDKTCSVIISERRTSKEEVVIGTGIMPIDIITRHENDNKDWISLNVPNLKPTKSSLTYSSKGINYGKGLNPGARVSGNSQRLLA